MGVAYILLRPTSIKLVLAALKSRAADAKPDGKCLNRNDLPSGTFGGEPQSMFMGEIGSIG
jgi:hypothetical protein